MNLVSSSVAFDRLVDLPGKKGAWDGGISKQAFKSRLLNIFHKNAMLDADEIDNMVNFVFNSIHNPYQSVVQRVWDKVDCFAITKSKHAKQGQHGQDEEGS